MTLKAAIPKPTVVNVVQNVFKPRIDETSAKILLRDIESGLGPGQTGALERVEGGSEFRRQKLTIDRAATCSGDWREVYKDDFKGGRVVDESVRLKTSLTGCGGDAVLALLGEHHHRIALDVQPIAGLYTLMASTIQALGS